jgi:hypothetical protein
VSIKDEEAEADSEAEKLSPLLDASAEPVACSSPRGDKRSSLNATTVLSSPTEYYPSNALPSDEKVNIVHCFRQTNLICFVVTVGR